MKQNHLLLSVAGLIAAGTASAEWTVINTFDDASALATVTDTINVEGSGAGSTVVDGMWALNPGSLFETTSNLYAMQDLGVDLKAASLVSADGFVTLYFEMMQPIVDDGAGGTRKAIVDHAFGTSNIDEDEILTERYNSFSAMQRVQVGDTYEVRDGGSYAVVDALQGGVKYSVWIVADFLFGECNVYIQGGQWATQTMVAVDGDSVFSFRVEPSAEQTVDKFLVAVSRGNSIDGEKAIDPLYFDSIAVDTSGSNLTMPPVGTGPEMGPGFFGNYEVVEVDGFGWVNTGNWLGWVMIEDYPYIWYDSIHSWGFISDLDMSGDKDAGGAWIYQFKRANAQ